ncbi:diiron oxygenase [Lentzea sp. HUAS12]|uniref:diiron oxygenase n=1 Tax=Lentzea sp. HUAS12 TaxID=2951806 RepID=UPI00209D757E|nr:diiron oxygenase [Lentzea sp. HUAS12]USX56196.1 diiron oxygenase [Lentzea sp. HUAS12]
MYESMAQEQLLRGDASARPPVTVYASRYERWEDLASVRRKPRRDYVPGEETSDLFFPPELYPVVLHPLVAAKGEVVVKALLLCRLYDYLDFTTELENLAVIPVATKISRGRSGLVLPPQMKADAFKIVTDEAWHAQFSHDFARQIEAGTTIPYQVPEHAAAPSFLRRLDEVREELPHDIRGVESLLFAIVSETLISGILSDIPRDERLPGSVRELVRDHAADEGRHHQYFRTLLKHLWPALTPREQQAIGPHVPAVVDAFLEPDYEQSFRHLLGIGLTGDEAAQVIAESWPPRTVRRTIAEAARPVVRYFAEAGALDDARTRDAFERADLWGVHATGDLAAS